MSFSFSASGPREHALAQLEEARKTITDGLGTELVDLLYGHLDASTGQDDDGPLQFEISASGHSDEDKISLDVHVGSGHFSGHAPDDEFKPTHG